MSAAFFSWPFAQAQKGQQNFKIGWHHDAPNATLMQAWSEKTNLKAIIGFFWITQFLQKETLCVHFLFCLLPESSTLLGLETQLFFLYHLEPGFLCFQEEYLILNSTH